jgi:hypothetical protein
MHKDYQSITVEDVLGLTKPTTDFLCPLEANIYEIEFVYFKIRNYDNSQTLFEIRKAEIDYGKTTSSTPRFVQYQFGPNFFKLKNVSTSL